MIGWISTLRISCCCFHLSSPLLALFYPSQFTIPKSERRKCRSNKDMVLKVSGTPLHRKLSKILTKNLLESPRFKSKKHLTIKNWEPTKKKGLNIAMPLLSATPKRQLMKYIKNVMEINLKAQISFLIFDSYLTMLNLMPGCWSKSVTKFQFQERWNILWVGPWVIVAFHLLGRTLSSTKPPT